MLASDVDTGRRRRGSAVEDMRRCLIEHKGFYKMVITSLEAHVASEKWPALEQAFKQAIRELDHGIVETFLLHSSKDEVLWQIVTVWESREVLDAMRNSGATPRGVLIFRAAGAEPTLSVLNVVSHASANAQRA